MNVLLVTNQHFFFFFFDAGDENHLAMYGMKEAHESSGVIPGVPVSMSRPL